MGTVTTRKQAPEIEVWADPPLSADTRPDSVVSRLLTWYRSAVLEPETEQEKTEWQRNSF